MSAAGRAALAALRRAEVVADVWRAARPTVLEVGAGGTWVGTLRDELPPATYVVADEPDRLRAAAASLLRAFPDATGVDWAGGEPVPDEADLLFVAAGELAVLPWQQLAPGLVLGSLDGRGASELERLAALVYRSAVPYVYCETEDGGVPAGAGTPRAALAAYYWLYELSVGTGDRDDPRPPAGSRPRLARDDPAADGIVRRRHLVGRRRLRVLGPGTSSQS